MVEGFRVLTVHPNGDTVIAVLPHHRLLGLEYREGLEHDYLRLSQLGGTAVRLDLRAVEYIDGAFLGLLIKLVKGLAAGDGRLTVEVSDNLAEILRITKMDRLFEVVRGPGDAGAAGQAEPAAEAEGGGG